MTPIALAVVDALPAEEAGMGSALNDTSQEISGALGVAVLGSVFNAGYRDALPGGLPEVQTGMQHAGWVCAAALAVVAVAGIRAMPAKVLQEDEAAEIKAPPWLRTGMSQLDPNRAAGAAAVSIGSGRGATGERASSTNALRHYRSTLSYPDWCPPKTPETPVVVSRVLYELSVADARRVAEALHEAAAGADREGLALIDLDQVIMMVSPGVRCTTVNDRDERDERR